MGSEGRMRLVASEWDECNYLTFFIFSPLHLFFISFPSHLTRSLSERSILIISYRNREGDKEASCCGGKGALSRYTLLVLK